MGKKMELEEDHISSCKADHWVRNLGVNVGTLPACCPAMSLHPETGCSCSWNNWGRQSRELGPTGRHVLAHQPHLGGAGPAREHPFMNVSSLVLKGFLLHSHPPNSRHSKGFMGSYRWATWGPAFSFFREQSNTPSSTYLGAKR